MISGPPPNWTTPIWTDGRGLTPFGLPPLGLISFGQTPFGLPLIFIDFLELLDFPDFLKGWLAISTLKPTLTFIGRDFAT